MSHPPRQEGAAGALNANVREPDFKPAYRRAARALGDLLTEMVCIGGAVAPLLQVQRHFHAPRSTVNVDAIVAEVQAAPDDIQSFVARRVSNLLELGEFEDRIAT